MKKYLLLPLSTMCKDTLPLVTDIRTWLAQHPDEFELIFLHDLSWSDDWLSPRDLLFADFADEFQQLGQQFFEQLTETLRLEVPKQLFISIIGNWLYDTMSSVLELHKLACAMREHLPLANACVLSFPSAALTAHESLDGAKICAGSTLRLAVFGEIATQLGMQSITIQTGAFQSSRKLRLKRKLTRYMNFSKNWILEGCYNFLALALRTLHGGPSVIADSRRMAIAIFSLKHKVFPRVVNLKLSLFFKRGRDQALRQRIGSALQSNRNDFSKLFLGLVPDLIPVELLENNLQRLTTVPQSKPGPASAIFSFNNITGPELARTQLKQGPHVERVTVTHGGGYGIDGAVGEELTDGAISHTLFTFGWATRLNTLHFRPDFLVASHVRHNHQSAKPFPFAFIGISPPLYCYKISSLPTSPNQLHRYYSDQQQFLSDVGPNLAGKFVFRPSPTMYGHTQERWYKVGPRNGTVVPIFDSPKFSCLAYDLLVVDHIGTSLTIRALANLPFLVFCRPEWWQINVDALALITRLRHCGVWHDSPESAAIFARKISGDINSWWTAKDTVGCIDDLRNHYCGANSLALREAAAGFLSTLQAGCPLPANEPSNTGTPKQPS